MTSSDIKGGAIITDDGKYRYHLWRKWNSNPSVLFVALNPSTADATVDDPTVRRMIDFGKLWGYGRMDLVNLYALRSTDPKKLKLDSDPVGPENDDCIEEAIAGCRYVVAAWGVVHDWMRERANRVVNILTKHREVNCLGLTKSGDPRHPLYIARLTMPEMYRALCVKIGR